MFLGPTRRPSNKGPSNHKMTKSKVPKRRSGNGSVPRKPPEFKNTAPGRALDGAQKFASVASQAALVIGVIAFAGTIYGAKAASEGAQTAVDKAGKEIDQWQNNPTQKVSAVSKEVQNTAVTITADIVEQGTTAATGAAGIATSAMNTVQNQAQRGVDTATNAVNQGVNTAKNAPRKALGSIGAAASETTISTSKFFGRLKEALGKIKKSLSESSQSLNRNSPEDNRDNNRARLSSLYNYLKGIAPQTFDRAEYMENTKKANAIREKLVSLFS